MKIRQDIKRSQVEISACLNFFCKPSQAFRTLQGEQIASNIIRNTERDFRGNFTDRVRRDSPKRKAEVNPDSRGQSKLPRKYRRVLNGNVYSAGPGAF